MVNLLEEIRGFLKLNGKEIKDIIWVRNKDVSIPLENFLEVAKNTNYSYSLAPDLKIVGKDFIMIRNQDSCCEWWEFYSQVKPTRSCTVKTLLGGCINYCISISKEN